ncbi:MAG: zinc-dependent peptidase, partial [Verrucomicrobiia bacterium]
MDVIWEKLKAMFGNEEPVEVVFKEEWKAILQEHLPLYSKFNDKLRIRVHEKIARFVATTYFEGCGGLELTDEMILSVAGQACMLIVNHEGEPYPNLKSVLIYPSTFGSKEQRVNEGGVVTSELVYRLGESWSNGTVVLAWDSVARGARNIY